MTLNWRKIWEEVENLSYEWEESHECNAFPDNERDKAIQRLVNKAIKDKEDGR